MPAKLANMLQAHLRKLGLCACLTLCSLPSLSDPAPEPPEGWKKVFSQFNIYVHVGSISRAEGHNGATFLSVWSLQNLEGEPLKVGAVVAKSARTMHEIDCKWRTEKQAYKVFADWNGTGQELMAAAPEGRKPIEPGSFEQALAHKYCSALTFWR